MTYETPLSENHMAALVTFANGGETISEVAEARGVMVHRVESAILSLRRHGYIEIVGMERRFGPNKTKIFSLTELGRKVALEAIAHDYKIERYTPPSPVFVFVQRRDPCVRCGVRGDIGCAHQPRDEGALLAA